MRWMRNRPNLPNPFKSSLAAKMEFQKYAGCTGDICRERWSNDPEEFSPIQHQLPTARLGWRNGQRFGDFSGPNGAPVPTESHLELGWTPKRTGSHIRAAFVVVT